MLRATSFSLKMFEQMNAKYNLNLMFTSIKIKFLNIFEI